VKKLTQALAKVPEAITGPGSLRNLQECFDLIAQVISTIGDTKVNAPKVPKALNPENPEQLGFNFTACIQNSKQLQKALNIVHDLASQSNPSRVVLATYLHQIADSLERGDH
jgi:hypothetical protein